MPALTIELAGRARALPDSSHPGDDILPAPRAFAQPFGLLRPHSSVLGHVRPICPTNRDDVPHADLPYESDRERSRHRDLVRGLPWKILNDLPMVRRERRPMNDQALEMVAYADLDVLADQASDVEHCLRSQSGGRARIDRLDRRVVGLDAFGLEDLDRLRLDLGDEFVP